MENSIDLKLTIDVVTGEAVASLVIAILEFLLYQRKQIPLVWKTFKYFISQWEKTEKNDDEVTNNFQLERQRTVAKQTLDNIRAMKEVIRSAFQRGHVSNVRFSFGSNPITPKEVYTIKIPTISRNHSYEHHKLETRYLNQTLISLLTADNLDRVFVSHLAPTNTYLQLQMPDNLARDWSCVFSTEIADLPASCKRVVMNIIHELPLDCVKQKCCKELKVFEDIANLSLNDEIDHPGDTCSADYVVGWWEASTFARGFQEKALKGCKLWQ